jgi:hypothetical protein
MWSVVGIKHVCVYFVALCDPRLLTLLIAHRIWFCCQKMRTYISREGQNAHSGDKWGNSHISDITEVSNFWVVLKVHFVKKILKICAKCSHNAHLTSILKTHTLHLEKCAQNIFRAHSKVNSTLGVTSGHMSLPDLILCKTCTEENGGQKNARFVLLVN